MQLLRHNGFREDAYIRPSVYKSSEVIGVRLHDLEHKFVIVTLPFGNYIDTDRGISALTTSWRRNTDLAIPARSKVMGAYVNSAFCKSDANLNGHDEAIVLTADGHVSEGSAENLFIVRDGQLVTPPVTDDILEGVTRAGLIELARRELGLETDIRSIDRSELYVADEVLLCGTGAQVSPVTSIDHRPVGSGEVGPITLRLKDALLRRRARARSGLRGLGHPGLLTARPAPPAQRYWGTVNLGVAVPVVIRMNLSVLMAGSSLVTMVTPNWVCSTLIVSASSASAPL